MKKLSKEKLNQLVLVGLLTVGALAGLWFLVVSAQKDKLRQIATKITETQQKIDNMQKVVNEANLVAGRLKAYSDRVTEIENAMPSGDLFLWMNTEIRKFNNPSYRVDLPNLGQPIVSEVTMFPKFPYHQAGMRVTGTAHYYDLGRFVADFENRFPYMRLQNLQLDPGGGATADEREKLTFSMDIIALVKTQSP